MWARIATAFSGMSKGKKVAAGAAGAGAVVGYSVAEGGNPVGKMFSGTSKIVFVGGLIVIVFIVLRKS